MIKGKQIYHILFKDQKLIFTVIPKNANTSVKHILLNYIYPHILKIVDYKHVTTFHSSTLKYFEFVDNKFCYENTDYLKITIVRNPFDRLVSGWNDKIRTLNVNNKKHKPRFGFPQACTFEQFIKQIYDIEEENINRHFIPQYRFITYNDTLFSNKILRFEDLNNQWNDLVYELKRTHNIKLNKMDINLNNTNRKKHYREYYNKELIKLVEEKFEKDLNMFNYQF